LEILWCFDLRCAQAQGHWGFKLIYYPINYNACGFPQRKPSSQGSSHCPVALGDKGVLGWSPRMEHPYGGSDKRSFGKTCSWQGVPRHWGPMYLTPGPQQADLGRAYVRFPGGKRSCDSALERLRTGSQVGRRRLSASVDLGETMQKVSGYWQRRDGGCSDRTAAGRASTSNAVVNWRQIGFSDPWRERYGSEGGHASLFSIFFKEYSARLCVQQVRCRFDSLAATPSLNCRVGGSVTLFWF
jgi:hypothetical protein